MKSEGMFLRTQPSKAKSYSSRSRLRSAAGTSRSRLADLTSIKFARSSSVGKYIRCDEVDTKNAKSHAQPAFRAAAAPRGCACASVHAFVNTSRPPVGVGGHLAISHCTSKSPNPWRPAGQLVSCILGTCTRDGPATRGAGESIDAADEMSESIDAATRSVAVIANMRLRVARFVKTAGCTHTPHRVTVLEVSGYQYETGEASI